MLITANILRDGKTVSDGITFGRTGKPRHAYSVAAEDRHWAGRELTVVAGPHLDFADLGAHDVYTVELSPPEPQTPNPIAAHLPFFNSNGWLEHVTVHVE